jgi:H+/Cl- antiporter ClcA
MTATQPAQEQPQLAGRRYLALVLLGVVVGLPAAFVSALFLGLVHEAQQALWPDDPAWYLVVGLPVVGAAIVAAARAFLPGDGGHRPLLGIGSPETPLAHVPGIAIAAFATLAFGAVLGPEAPLIAVGSGLGLLAMRLVARDAPENAHAVIAAAGSFAAISALFGSPLLAAFLLLEAAGLAGPQVAFVLMPGLLSAGIGTLVFVGLNSLTGLGPVTLAIPNLPPFDHPTVPMFGWAIAFGLGAAVLGKVLHAIALRVRPHVERRLMLLLPVLGLLVAGLAVGFGQATDKGYDQVLFSGQQAIGPLVTGAGTWSVGALMLLVACKGIAYSLSLSAFRGGAVFPAMFIGAAVGVAAAGLPGLELVPGVAMGIGAMCAVMLRLPLTSVLLATLLLFSNGLEAMPLVIVAVVVAHVAAARIDRPPVAAAA